MKTCFKCNETLPLTDFYKHKQMADGHLGKCKECAKKYVADRVQLKQKTDLDWTLEERERHRIKSQKARAEGRASKSPNHQKKAFLDRNPIKKAAHILTCNAIRDRRLIRKPCEVCGAKKVQAHHDDYHKPMEVRWLCIRCHNDHHIKERELLLIENFGKPILQTTSTKCASPSSTPTTNSTIPTSATTSH